MRTCTVAIATCLAGATPAAERCRIDYDRIATGFVAEARNDDGFPAGSGFSRENPWGQYTAYLMYTDRSGRRTWRIEHNLPRPGTGTSQGSTMYLLEGARRALLIDTGNPAAAVEGVNDLKTVVRTLLARDNAGHPVAHPLDFVVANTHNHPDHIGENARMADRVIYYMDRDWPDNAPSNYVPIREGGGPTAHAGGMAVADIELGRRTLKAIDVPPHTPGSVAYLDPGCQLLFSGDALGSGWPFLQQGPMTTFVASMHHLLEIAAPYPNLVVLPAHYYQLGAYDRAAWAPAQRVLDRQYVEDLATLAQQLVSGEAIGRPFPSSLEDYWAVHGKAKIVYRPDTLDGGNSATYHVVEIPGGPPQASDAGLGADAAQQRIRAFHAQLFLIRGPHKESLFLVRGSRRALLIGMASMPGLAPLALRLADGLPVDVAIPDVDAVTATQIAQLPADSVFVSQHAQLGDPRVHPLPNGAQIDLGPDPDGAAMIMEAQELQLPGTTELTLRSVRDRVLFVGPPFGSMTARSALAVTDPLGWENGLGNWLKRVGGRFDVAYGTGSAAWFSAPAFFDRLLQILDRAVTGRGIGKETNGPEPGTTTITSELSPDAAISIRVPKQSERPASRGF